MLISSPSPPSTVFGIEEVKVLSDDTLLFGSCRPPLLCVSESWMRMNREVDEGGARIVYSLFIDLSYPFD